MEKIDLEQYKNYLINNYTHKCDDNEISKQKRIEILNNKYKNEYLESIITGTYNFSRKIITSYNNESEYIEIPSYYLYIQCKKEIINDVKKKLVRTTDM